MDYDEQTLYSMPTTAGGVRPLRADIDEPSLGSAPTIVGQGVPGAAMGQIDQYQLVRKLGGGGFGVVYLARDTVSGVDVALKTLHPLLKSNPEEMEALRTKFALVSRLSHTNIASPLVLHPVQRIAITDDGVRNELRLSPGDFIMVMRYAPGVTLSKWRRQFPGGIVPLDQALEVVRQVASALDYAHGEKIVHRDIKPANIMVETIGDGESHTEAQRHREDGAKLRVRILDFGLAAEIRSSMSRISTETGDTSGTRPYMAPEQWLGRKQDGRTDQYALACVAYELLSGAPPFAGAFETGDPVIMMATVKGEAPEEVEDIPAHVNAALMRALAKNPKERFSSCAEFVEAISNADTQGTQRNSHTEAQRHTENISDAAKPESQNQKPASTSAISEAKVLRRKVALERTVKAIPAEDRADKELKVFVEELETELVVLDQACRYSRFAAAAESLDRADATLASIGKVKAARAEAERKAREEAERKAREERERKAREEAERKAREEAARKAKEEAERKAKEEAEHRAREEAERKVREETGLKAKTGGLSDDAIHRAEGQRGIPFGGVVGVAVSLLALIFLINSCNDKGSPTVAPSSPQASEARLGADALVATINLGGGVSLEMVHCPDVSSDFWMGKYEVTQEQWQRVMSNNPSYFKGARKPVEKVSWNDCQEFIRKLNALPGARGSGLTFRLPTRQEWDTACRAGAPQAANYCKLKDGTQITASTLSRVAMYNKRDDGTVDVGSFEPNAWGLFDMHGNVWEWADTAYGYYYCSGGCFYSTAGECAAGNWDSEIPDFGSRSRGFRLAASGRAATR